MDDRVDDFRQTLKRARTLVARLEESPHLNPNTGTKEFSVRDPDGYYVTISALGGGTGRSPARGRRRAGRPRKRSTSEQRSTRRTRS